MGETCSLPSKGLYWAALHTGTIPESIRLQGVQNRDLKDMWNIKKKRSSPFPACHTCQKSYSVLFLNMTVQVMGAFGD